jgi:hypothetical protein
MFAELLNSIAEIAHMFVEQSAARLCMRIAVQVSDNSELPTKYAGLARPPRRIVTFNLKPIASRTLKMVLRCREVHHSPDYDREPQGQNPLTGNLAAYVALLHLCGPEALGDDPLRPIEVDAWTVWHSAGVTLHVAASLALVIQQRRHDWRFSHL